MKSLNRRASVMKLNSMIIKQTSVTSPTAFSLSVFLGGAVLMPLRDNNTTETSRELGVYYPLADRTRETQLLFQVFNQVYWPPSHILPCKLAAN